MVIISHITDGRAITLPPHPDIKIQQKRGTNLTRDMANRDKRKNKLKNKTTAVILTIAGIAVLAVLAVLIWAGRHSEKREDTTGSREAEKVEAESDVVWKGKEYNYNEHLSNFLFIGVDNQEKVETETGQADAGQADALYLVSWDWSENTLELITIPRDTMTRIETFGPGGESLGESTDHISLSYAYGDGEHESCRLTREAVSALFYDLPIQGYCAVNMDALPVITESVGGVTVTVPNDSLEEVDSRFQEGAQVTLNADDTETFVRYRDIHVSQSAVSRMERQQAYIAAFGEKARELSASDSGFITKLYTDLEPYMVTNMRVGQFGNIMKSISAGKTSQGWTVPGEGVQGETYDEYHVDEDALYEKTIETFYEEAE